MLISYKASCIVNNNVVRVYIDRCNFALVVVLVIITVTKSRICIAIENERRRRRLATNYTNSIRFNFMYRRGGKRMEFFAYTR